jgi:small subunit ribosomal protein S17
MADQENTEEPTVDEAAPDAPDASAVEPEPEAAAEDAPAPAAEDAPAPAAEDAPAPAAPAPPPPEPVAQLTPQERKVAARARRGKRRGATPEERAELRRAKATARSRRRMQEKAKRTPGTGTPPADGAPGTPKVRLGRVVSDKADKTITVRIDDARRHRRYQKIVRTTSTLHAHDERNDANEGDLVRVIEARPTSRTKRWRLVEVLERAK